MNIYFDTEFTGLKKDTQLISIGLISEDGKEFYGEFASINTELLDDWIIENVLMNTAKYGEVNETDIVVNESDYHFGTREEIQEELKNWLSQFDEVQLISDVCHYDMVLFIDIFGSAFDLPDNVSPVCYDINQDIASYYEESQKDAFDRNREDILEEHGITIVGQKHNSLYDARVIQQIYNILNEENYYIKTV